MRLSGSLAVLEEVSFFFIPSMRAQNDFLRDPPSGWGALRFMPSFLAEALPLAFKPPEGDFPSLRCQAGVLAILSHRFLTNYVNLNYCTSCSCNSYRQNISYVTFNVGQYREEVCQIQLLQCIIWS